MHHYVTITLLCIGNVVVIALIALLLAAAIVTGSIQ